MLNVLIRIFYRKDYCIYVVFIIFGIMSSQNYRMIIDEIYD